MAFAAGAGITPIMAMLQAGADREPNTSFTLIYGNRTPQSILFREELEDLKDRHLGRFTLLHVLSRNEELSAPLFEGRITGEKVKAFAATLFRPADVAHVFLCGPGSMIKDARNALLALGMPREKIHFEFFAPGRRVWPPIAAPPPLTPPRKGEGECGRRAVKVEGTEAIAVLDGIRHRFIVPPGGHVVDAALAAGIACPTRARAACAAPAAPGSSRARPR